MVQERWQTVRTVEMRIARQGATETYKAMVS